MECLADVVLFTTLPCSGMEIWSFSLDSDTPVGDGAGEGEGMAER